MDNTEFLQQSRSIIEKLIIYNDNSPRDIFNKNEQSFYQIKDFFEMVIKYMEEEFDNESLQVANIAEKHFYNNTVSHFKKILECFNTPINDLDSSIYYKTIYYNALVAIYRIVNSIEETEKKMSDVLLSMSSTIERLEDVVLLN